MSLSMQQALNVIHYIQNSSPWAGRPSFAVKTLPNLQGFIMSIVTADQYMVFFPRPAWGMLGGNFLNLFQQKWKWRSVPSRQLRQVLLHSTWCLSVLCEQEGLGSGIALGCIQRESRLQKSALPGSLD